jgi:predicted  nucleic acid-binding Zn-ribbon protein
METIPTWWLVVTAIFAVAGTITFLALVFLVMALIKKMQEMQPKIDAISDKVERISERVENIATKVEGITASAKGTVDNIAGGAAALINSLTKIGTKVESGLSKFTPLLIGANIASGLYQTFSERKKGKAIVKAEDPPAVLRK